VPRHAVTGIPINHPTERPPPNETKCRLALFPEMPNRVTNRLSERCGNVFDINHNNPLRIDQKDKIEDKFKDRFFLGFIIRTSAPPPLSCGEGAGRRSSTPWDARDAHRKPEITPQLWARRRHGGN
jgi:hypothetical protein